jgi:hypothetical protein
MSWSGALSPTQRRALEVLMVGASTAATARYCQVSPRTVERWKRQPAFREALRQAQQDLLAQVNAQALARCLSAVETLYQVMANPQASASAKVAAAATLLAHVLKVQDQLVLADQLRQLQDELRRMQHAPLDLTPPAYTNGVGYGTDAALE